ncbi:uncharacterized protein V6R79_015706 [Siganus canaliculatus]
MILRILIKSETSIPPPLAFHRAHLTSGSRPCSLLLLDLPSLQSTSMFVIVCTVVNHQPASALLRGPCCPPLCSTRPDMIPSVKPSERAHLVLEAGRHVTSSSAAGV